MSDVGFYDVRVIDTTSTSIILDNGNIEEISVNYSKGCGVRALCGGSWGFTTAEGDFDLKATIASASELASQMNSISPKDEVHLRSVDEPVIKDLPVAKIDPADVPIEEKVQLLKDIEDHAKVDGISSTSAVYSEARVNIHYISSEGKDVEYDLIRSGFAISAVATENGSYQVGRESRFGVCGFELFKENDVLALARSAGDSAIDLLGAEQAKGGTLPVILDPELAGVFAHEAVGHASEADLVLEGSSILADRLGEQIASPLINIIDDPTLHEYGYYPFDSEGVMSSKTTLIKDGVLNSYLHSRETAEALNGTPGNCRAQGYSEPIVRMSNTYIDNGDSNFDEMLEDIGDGMYLTGSRGGQVNTGEGIFQFNAEKGYLVENGEVTRLLRDVSLSGKTLEILNNVTLVGNDLKMHSGRCGKGGQLAPVSDGSPHISISKALVGGV